VIIVKDSNEDVQRIYSKTGNDTAL